MKKFVLAASFALLPAVAFAQLGNVENIVDSIGRLVSAATPIVVGLALLAFFWGLAKYIFAAGDEEKKSEGKNIMIWGVIALFVMISVWGIVRFIADAIGIDPDESPIVVPGVPLN